MTRYKVLHTMVDTYGEGSVLDDQKELKDLDIERLVALGAIEKTGDEYNPIDLALGEDSLNPALATGADQPASDDAQAKIEQVQADSGSLENVSDAGSAASNSKK